MFECKSYNKPDKEILPTNCDAPYHNTTKTLIIITNFYVILTLLKLRHESCHEDMKLLLA